jgi:putative tryptophan/tyrosine transport system substrate-binding protein
LPEGALYLNNGVVLRSGKKSMRRREFITLFAGAAATRPVAVRAQHAKLPTIGFLGAGSEESSPWITAFTQRLRELGWIDGRNVAIDLRWAQGRKDRSAEIAAEFVRQKVDVIVTYSNEHVEIAKQSTSTIPIVFAFAGDPLGTGLVASLARPGGNLTGLSSQNVDLAGKRFELLREVIPGLRRLAILFNVNNANSPLEFGIIQAAARPLGLEVLPSEIQRTDDIAPALVAIKGHADAMYVVGDPLTFVHRTQINTLAISERLPTVFSVREYVEAGGLMSYGPSFPTLFRRAGDYVDKILRGAKPADIPVEQGTKYDLVINLATAKALGLTIPEPFLLRVDEAIK